MTATSCERVRRLLSAYLDERLPPEPQRAVSLHLATCDACRAERDALEELSMAATAMPYDQLAPRLADRVRARRRPSPWPTRVAAVAGLSLALLGAYGLGRSHGRAPESEATTWELPAEAAAVVDAARERGSTTHGERSVPRALPAVLDETDPRDDVRPGWFVEESESGASYFRIEVRSRSSPGPSAPRR
ncbi:MAG: zf-HC2 domain-containing protein [Planctomycetota bacterium]